MKKCVILMIVAIVCIASSRVSAVADDSLSARVAILEEWMPNAESGIGNINHKDLADVLDFFKENLCIGEPDSSTKELSAKVLDCLGEKKTIVVVPLIKADENISGVWKKYLDGGLPSYFAVNPHHMPIIIINGNIKMTETWKKLSLFHEGSRGKAFLAETSNKTANPAILRAKRAKHEFGCYQEKFNLLEIVGGEEYRKLLAQETEKAKVMYEKNKMVTITDYRQAIKLDPVFGPAESDAERESRWATFCLHAYFKAIDQLYQDRQKAKDFKIDLLYTMYRAN